MSYTNPTHAGEGEQSATAICYIDHLPAELVEQIHDYVKFEDLKILRRVDTKMASLLNPRVFRNTRLDFTSAGRQNLLATCSSLPIAAVIRSLRVHIRATEYKALNIGSRCTDDDTRNAIVSMLARLQRLDLDLNAMPGVYDVIELDVNKFLQATTNLSSLRIDCAHGQLDFAYYTRNVTWNNLRDVELSRISTSAQCILAFLSKTASTLKTLHLDCVDLLRESLSSDIPWPSTFANIAQICRLEELTFTTWNAWNAELNIQALAQALRMAFDDNVWHNQLKSYSPPALPQFGWKKHVSQ